MDTITAQRRSENMSRIRGKDTKPELAVRHLAHGLGYRFRLYRRDLPGAPDLVFPRLGKVIFVHGCFWHRHPGCRFAYRPKSNTGFWRAKFAGNVARDARALLELETLGWEAEVIWECELREPSRLSGRIASYLGSKDRQDNRESAGSESNLELV